jgi:hypothetical protein
MAPSIPELSCWCPTFIYLPQIHYQEFPTQHTEANVLVARWIVTANVHNTDKTTKPPNMFTTTVLSVICVCQKAIYSDLGVLQNSTKAARKTANNFLASHQIHFIIFTNHSILYSSAMVILRLILAAVIKLVKIIFSDNPVFCQSRKMVRRKVLYSNSTYKRWVKEMAFTTVTKNAKYLCAQTLYHILTLFEFLLV